MGIIENFKLVYKNKDLRLLLLSRPLPTHILQTELLPIVLFKSNIIQENVFLQSILLIFFMNIIPIADITSFVMDYVRNVQRFRLYLLFVSSIPLFLIGIILLSFYNNLTLPIFFLILVLQSMSIFSVRYNGVLIFPAFKKFNEEKVFFSISQVTELFLQITFALGALIIFLIGLYGVKVLAIFYLLSGIYEAITNGIRLRVRVESRDKTGISISKQAFKEYFNLLKHNKRFFYIVFLLPLIFFSFIGLTYNNIYFYSLFGKSKLYYQLTALLDTIQLISSNLALITSGEISNKFSKISDLVLFLFSPLSLYFAVIFIEYGYLSYYSYFIFVFIEVFVAIIYRVIYGSLFTFYTPKEYVGHFSSISSIMDLLASTVVLTLIGYIAEYVGVTVSAIVIISIVLPTFTIIYFATRKIPYKEYHPQ